ncbi:pentapeptide repeat-containing protein [Nostoc sp.]|uniref:pentapeptide repeat-containing protein n=1 Tax=Nostoc sp. TaxID=1180 RepID=UPI002FF576C5
MSGANLTKACLSGAELDGTDMSRANLLYAAISETYFAADVRGAINVDTVDFTGTPVRGLVLEDGTIIDSDHDW